MASEVLCSSEILWYSDCISSFLHWKTKQNQQNANNSFQSARRPSLGVRECVVPITRHDSPAPSVGRELPVPVGPGSGICVHDSVMEIKSLFHNANVKSGPKWIFANWEWLVRSFVMGDCISPWLIPGRFIAGNSWREAGWWRLWQEHGLQAEHRGEVSSRLVQCSRGHPAGAIW